jgi:hypothetical protein
MSSIKPKENPNHELSKEHIEILKKELGILEREDREGENHRKE